MKLTNSNCQQKSNIASIPKVDIKKRRLVFCKQVNLLQKLKTDLILVLNKSL